VTLYSLRKILPIALLLTGCASDPIEYSGNATAIPVFRSFKVEERYVFPDQLTAEQRTHVGAELRNAAVGALQSRGYREASANESADVVVVLGAISRTAMATTAEEDQNRHVNQVDTSVFVGSNSNELPEAVGGSAAIGFSREGDLILYVLDPATQRSLWRASASGAASSSGEALRKARSTYRAMVRNLPAAPRS
jgi:Domain of unknown function (DUF4136)